MRDINPPSELEKILAQQPEKPKKKTKLVWKGFFLRIGLLLLLVLIVFLAYFGHKVYVFEKKIQQEAPSNYQENYQEKNTSFLQTAKTLVTQEKIPLRGAEDDRINILLLGMGGEGHSGKYLTDTIILASINPKTYQSALLSIPRDLYINIPDTNLSTKINAVYAYGMQQDDQNPTQAVESLSKAIKQITGQQVDYYIAMNFDGFEKIIDEIDGIDVEVPEDLYDNRYPGPNFSYTTFEINKGFHHLDGETSLKYSRVRHVSGGDFGRAARQQQVLAATKKKSLSLGTILNPVKISGLLDVLGDNIKTDIRLDEIPSFIDLAKNVNIYQTTNKVLDAWNPDSLLISSHVPLGGVQAYVLVPRAKNYFQIKELASNLFDLGMIERKKKSVEEEAANLKVIADPKDKPQKIKNLFLNWGYKNIEITKNDGSFNCADKTQVIKNTDKPVIFTLDDLNQKLDAEVLEKPYADMTEDVIICLADDYNEYLDRQNEKAEDEDANLKEQSIIDEKGKIRYNEEK